ncbi:LytTR family DNA-binding domain-containing protein [Aestuariibius sp. 2305UL40-4]|uniref:LytTR family DNA-binding domain-containing protein n=1 Tax=Aestuariibius violaceus TaxID=3234132 RepID=UPI00345E448B
MKLGLAEDRSRWDGFWRDLVAYCLSPPTFITVASVTVIVAVAGPFGTAETQSFIERFIYWGLVLSIAMPFGFASKLLILRLRPDFPGSVHAFCTASFFTALYAPMLWWLCAIISAGQSRETLSLALLSAGLWMLAQCVSLARLVLDMDPMRPSAPAEVAPEMPEPRLARRVELTPGARIVRLTAEGHFVDVHSDDGRVQRIRLRFADAVDEMEGVPGYCVHRSHWVAVAAIASRERESGRDFVRLQDGSRVPVGRKYKPQLVEEGVI